MTTPELRETLVTPAPRGVERYELPTWRSRFGIVAGITSRPSDFTLAGARPAGAPADHWAAFHAEHETTFPSVQTGYQCHGVHVLTHRVRPRGLVTSPDTDGHVTALCGVLLTVTVADCVPVYLAASDGTAVGLLHAGWRGIAAGIIEHGIAAFCSAAHSSARDIVSHCGVAICGICYEVGPEVVQQVLGERTAGSTGLDLRRAVAARLVNAGVSEVTLSPWCTVHDTGRFHSHRAAGGRAGRMLAYAGRPLA